MNPRHPAISKERSRRDRELSSRYRKFHQSRTKWSGTMRSVADDLDSDWLSSALHEASVHDVGAWGAAALGARAARVNGLGARILGPALPGQPGSGAAAPSSAPAMRGDHR